MWPAGQNTPATWPRLAEAGGRPELHLALAGRAEAYYSLIIAEAPVGGCSPRVGAQRFRLSGLFVVPEPAGAEYETDYKWVLPKYTTRPGA